jgi:hypothetical protein
MHLYGIRMLAEQSCMSLQLLCLMSAIIPPAAISPHNPATYCPTHHYPIHSVTTLMINHSIVLTLWGRVRPAEATGSHSPSQRVDGLSTKR